MDATADISDCIDPARLGVSLPPPRALPPVELPGSFARPLGVREQPAGDRAGAGRSAAFPNTWSTPGRTTSGLTSWLRHAQELDAVRVRDEPAANRLAPLARLATSLVALALLPAALPSGPRGREGRRSIRRRKHVRSRRGPAA